MRRPRFEREILAGQQALAPAVTPLHGPLRLAALRVCPVAFALGFYILSLLPAAASAQEANPLPTMDLSTVAGQNVARPRSAAPQVQLTPAPAVQLSPAQRPAAVAEAPQVEVNGLHGLMGKFQVVPHAEARVTADDNIFITRHKVGDVYTTLSAGVAAGWGDFRNELNANGAYLQTYESLGWDFDDRNYLFAGYTPSVTVFAGHSGENTFDHAVQLGTQWHFGNLSASLHSEFRTFSQPEIDAGDRLKQTLFKTDLRGRYEVSDKTSVEMGLYNTTHHYRSGNRIDSSDWENRDYLDYQLFPKTRVGLGVTLGYLDVETGPAQVYEQALARVNYDTQHKLAFHAEGGIEFRQPESGGQNKVNPVFGAGATYEPFEGTVLAVGGRRNVRSSIIFSGVDVAVTSVVASVSQQLFGKTTLTISGTYQHLDYEQTAARRRGLSRTDNALDVEASYAFHFTKWVGLTLAYDYSEDSSTLAEFGFENNRASLQMDVLF